MSGAKRPVDYGAAPPHKKRRSPSTSSSSSSGRSSSTAGPARKESSGKHGRGAVGVLGDYYRTGEVAGNNRRWDTVIPDSQSPAPIPKQEDDIKPDPFFTYRSGSLTSTDSSAFGASGSPSSHSHSSEDVDIKPFPFERSRSLSTESKPSDDELGRSLNSGSSHSGDSSSRGSLDSDVKNFELDIKLEPGIEYRAPWLEERAQYAPRAVGVGPRPQPQPATIRSQPLSHFEADRSRSHAPSPVTETHVDVKDEAEDHTMATFDGMPPPRAPLSRATEMDMRRRERSVTNEHENDDYPEGDDESRSSRAGSTRSESAAQEERAYSIAAEGSQTSSPPRRQEEEEAQWREGSEDAVEEDQGAVEIELEPRPEADPVDDFLSSFLPAGPQPIGVKARLQNELARSTALYTAENRVLPVPKPPQPRVTLPSYAQDVTMDDDDSTPTPLERDPSPRSPSRSPSPPPPPPPRSFSMPEAVMAAARGLSPEPEFISVLDAVDDELEHYEEDDPTPNGGLGDILAPQPHHERPTEEGTVHRWYLVLSATQGKVAPISEEFNYSQLGADVTLLQHHDIPVSPDGITFLPPRRYLAPGSDGLKLLTEMPGGDPSSLFSCTRLDEMWSDFGNEGEDYRYRPRWEPEKVEWEEMLKKLKKEGVKVEDLMDVLEEVFARGRRTVDEALLREIYNKNWLWFDQLRQLARVRNGYFSLATDNTIIETHTLHQKLKSSWTVEVEAKKRTLGAAKEDRDMYRTLLDELREMEYGKRRNRIDALGALADRLRRIDEKKSKVEAQRA